MQKSDAPRLEFKGEGASKGIVVGPAYLFRGAYSGEAERAISSEEVASEVERLERALDVARRELGELAKRTEREAGAEAAAVFEAQLLMVDDPELTGRARAMIGEKLYDAEGAIRLAGDEACSLLSQVEDEYLRARVADVRDVVARILSALRGGSRVPVAEPREPAVVLAEELLPSETMLFDRSKVLAFVTERGSSTSHVAILARTLGIPAVVGVVGVLGAVSGGETVALDGGAGLVVVNPGPEELKEWEARREAWARRREELLSRADLVAETTDGHRVELAANIGSPADVGTALEYGAEGVGLFRTEFLFMERESPPEEDEQFEAYRRVAEAMAGRPVIVRTLDVGGDKAIPWLGRMEEANPFLGLRGVRLTLDRPELLLVQLRAILRARVYGDLWVMLPMITTLGEVRAVRQMLQRAAEELRTAGKEHAEAPLGIMIEVPSAALLAERLLEEVDFASVGTNDLTQYTLAVDRTNEKVGPLADALHPAVLRLVAAVAAAGRKREKWVGVCGDLAGDPLAAPILVGLGVKELSMAPPLLPEVKEAIRALSMTRAEEIARRALSCATAEEVRELLVGVLAARFP